MVKTSGLNHVALRVKDVDKSIAFYEKVLGLNKIPRPVANVPGEWFGVGSNQLHLIGQDPEGEIDPRRPHMALNVDDLEATKAELKRMGVPFLEASRSRLMASMSPESRKLVGEQIWLLDPDGNMIELRQDI